MPHGGPDWGTLGPLATVYTVEDMAELAARLGSIVTFDRRGNVIFMEDFQGSLAKVNTDWPGASGSVAISNERALHGAFSCKLVTLAEAAKFTEVYLRLAYTVLGKLGVEVAWDMVDDSLMDSIEIWFQLYDGTYYHKVAVSWEPSTKKWWYQGVGEWKELSPTQILYSGDVSFNITKLVVDFVNQEYVRLISNNREYDMSGLVYSTLTPPQSPHILQTNRVIAAGDAACTVYLGHIIVTQNEP